MKLPGQYDEMNPTKSYLSKTSRKHTHTDLRFRKIIRCLIADHRYWRGNGYKVARTSPRFHAESQPYQGPTPASPYLAPFLLRFKATSYIDVIGYGDPFYSRLPMSFLNRSCCRVAQCRRPFGRHRLLPRASCSILGGPVILPFPVFQYITCLSIMFMTLERSSTAH